MAKATLTFEDTEEGFEVQIDWDPPYKPGASEAQDFATGTLYFLKNGVIEELMTAECEL